MSVPVCRCGHSEDEHGPKGLLDDACHGRIGIEPCMCAAFELSRRSTVMVQPPAPSRKGDGKCRNFIRKRGLTVACKETLSRSGECPNRVAHVTES
jgi:hypothetical protein